MRRASFVLLALLQSCGSSNDGEQPPTSKVSGTLTLELRDEAVVTIEGSGAAPTISVEVTNGHGVMPSGERLVSPGRVDDYPEAGMTITTARYSTAGDTSGPCGAGPTSLALSLHRDGDNGRVGGALTAYCGADTWYGRPVRVLRLDGQLPR